MNLEEIIWLFREESFDKAKPYLWSDNLLKILASEAQREAFRHAMGFDRPLPVQFVDFVAKAIKGDFGNSLHYRLPALPLVLERLPATLQLAFSGLLMALVIAIPLGLIGGARPGSWIDLIGRAIGLFGQTVPAYWLALVMAWICGIITYHFFRRIFDNLADK